MDGNDIQYLNFFYFLIFLIPMGILNHRFNLQTNKRMVKAIVRMILQLSLVGLYLEYMFQIDKGWLNLTYVILMMTVASFSVMKSCRKRHPRFLPLILISFAVPNLAMLLFFNAFIADIEIILAVRHTIPVAGMLLGNSLNSIIVATNRFYSSIRDNQKEYLTMLSISGNRQEALRPYFQEALKTALNPTLASIETMGLVALPGMMTGQILGGAQPLTAIKYQIAIMLAIMTVRYFAAILTILLTSLSSFSEYDLPLEENRPV